MADGFGVQLDGLRRSAAALRADAIELDSARRDASTAVQVAASAAGGGLPLTHATSELALQVDKAMGAVSRSIEECAAALDATAASYGAGEQRATSTIEGLLRPPFPPPR